MKGFAAPAAVASVPQKRTPPVALTSHDPAERLDMASDVVVAFPATNPLAYKLVDDALVEVAFDTERFSIVEEPTA